MGAGGAAVASAVGDVVGDVMNYASAKQQRDWEYHLSSTAHQREVNDLKAAGLNPILSAGGSGSSTPTGAWAQMDAPGGKIGDYLFQNELNKANVRDSNAAAAVKEKTAEGIELDNAKKRVFNAPFGAIPKEDIKNSAAAVYNTVKDVGKGVVGLVEANPGKKTFGRKLAEGYIGKVRNSAKKALDMGKITLKQWMHAMKNFHVDTLPNNQYQLNQNSADSLKKGN